MRLKLEFTSFTCFYYFVIDSIDAFYFVNVVVYKALMVKGKVGKLVYKIFIANLVPLHFSGT